MGSRMRQLRLLKIAVSLAAIVGATVVVSTALASSFPGLNGKLVYAVHAGNGTPAYIATANANGSGKFQISRPGTATQGDYGPRFSADGTKVVFTRNASKIGYNHLQIWIADANGGSQHEVTVTGLPAGGFPNFPTFTPDGKHIVFSIDTINSPIGLAVVSVGGGKATQITTGDDWQPAVSPDGAEIAFMRGYSLVVTDINGMNLRTLYTEPPSASSLDEPDWSPDGSTIAFMELDSSSSVWDIWTIAADGTDNGVATNLTNGTTTSSMDPAYSPDGSEIAFTAVDDSTYASSIRVMSSDGGAATAVVTPTKGFVGNPDWGVKTVTIPPKVVKVSPRAGAKGVADATSVTATWSESLASKSLVLTDSTGKTVKGTTRCSSSCTVVTFKPATRLKGHASYTARATGKNANGSSRKKWTFETK